MASNITNYKVTRIVLNAQETVSYYNGDTLQFTFKQVREISRDRPGGQYILLTDLYGKIWGFDVWSLVDLNGKPYTPIPINTGQLAITQYQERINEVYDILSRVIYKGCCSCACDPIEGDCGIQYQWSSDATDVTSGQFSYNFSGLLIMSPTSYLSQDLTGALDGLPEGSRITFTNTETPGANFVVFELGSGGLFSGQIIYTATILSGSVLSFVDEAIFCVQIDTGGSGGSEVNIYNSDGTQTDPVRTYDGDGGQLNFNNLDSFNVRTDSDAELISQDGSDLGDAIVTPTDVNLSVTDGTNLTEVDVQATEAFVQTSDGSFIAKILWQLAKLTLQGTQVGFQGIVEAADYSANYVLLSLLSVKALQNGTKISATASGTDTYTATIAPAPSAYATNQTFLIRFTNANTGASTINLNGLGAKSLVKNGATALASGDIPAGAILLISYDGTNFQVVGGINASSGGAFVPYDKATQTTDITGGPYDVDNASSSGFTIVNGTITTQIVILDGGIIIQVVDSGTSEQSIMAVDLTASQFEIDNAGGDQAIAGVRNSSGVVSSVLRAFQSSGVQTSVESFVDKLRFVTPFVAGGGDPTGMVLVGQNTDGDVEYQDLSGVFIPLAGTTMGSPVTGDIEIEDTNSGGEFLIYSNFNAGAIVQEIIYTDGGGIRVQSRNTGNNDSFSVTVGPTQIDITAIDGATGEATVMSMQKTLLGLSQTDGTNTTDIALSSLLATITSSDPDFPGAQYGADYSPKFGDLSLVTKKYVDANFKCSQPVTVSDLSVATVFGTGTGSLTVNTIAVDDQFDIEGEGFYTTDATPGTVSIDIVVAGITVATVTSTTLGALITGNYFNFKCRISFSTIGGTASVYASGTVGYQISATVVAQVPLNNGGASSTVDTTSPVVIDAIATLTSGGFATGGNFVTLNMTSVAKV